MRQYKRPYFQTKQYWGLVEILKECNYYNGSDKDNDINYNDLINVFCNMLQLDNPKFKKELFLKALKGDK